MLKGLKEFFTYNQRQRNGLLLLLAVIIVLQGVLIYDELFPVNDPSDFSEFISQVKQWELRDSLARLENQQVYHFHEFDPNSINADSLEAMGLPGEIALRLVNYREKIRPYRTADDLKNIYGLSDSLYQDLLPYIIIADDQEGLNTSSRNNTVFQNFNPNEASIDDLTKVGFKEFQARRIVKFRDNVHPFTHAEELYSIYGIDSNLVRELLPYVELDSVVNKKGRDIQTELPKVEINTADSLDLLTLEGIGPYFSHKILQYRERLGGFSSADQLLEVYNLDERRLEQFRGQLIIDKNNITRLNLNTAEFRELLVHPYLDYEVVKNIVNFREHVRPFNSVEELKNIELIDDQLFSKIADYLTIQNTE